MGIKAKIKKIVGQKNLQRVKAVKAQVKYYKTCGGQRLVMHSAEWENPVVYALPGRHVFFGYYDIQQLSPKGDKLLLTAVPLKADTRRDPAQLQWVDVATGSYHLIADTRAWCWQQGSRLRWHPVEEDTVLYNDVEDGRYVTRRFDLTTGNQRTLCRAVYDVAPDGRHGLALNYSRLQRLRPGYGYDALPDATAGEKVPKDDGIFLVDLRTGQEKLIVSYEKLVELAPEAAGNLNYANHISIAPDGSRFMFFHLWTPAIGARWRARLYTARMDGSELQCLEREYIPSHYCWRGSQELLITSVGFGGSESHYLLYDIQAGTRKMLDKEHLKNDGHPTYLADGVTFVTDTYPLAGSMQKLFLETREGEGYQPICDIYADPRRFEEKRCDLHPRLTPDGRIITIDSTFRDGKRSVLLFKRR